MVEPAKDRIRNNISEPLDRSCVGRVLSKRNVCSHFIIIGGIFRKNSSKVLCVECDQMISTLTPDRPDQTLNISVIRYVGRRCLTCSADLRGLAYGATIRDMGHREHVKCGQAAVGR